MFWQRLMYSSTTKTPASSPAIAAEVYFHFPFGVLLSNCPISRLAIWV